MKELLTGFLAALQFLTRLPVPARSDFRPNDLARSAQFFPLIGLLVAFGGLGVHFVSRALFEPECDRRLHACLPSADHGRIT